MIPFPFQVAAFDPGADGRVLVSGAGAMHEYVTDTDGDIEVDPDSLYEGMPAGRVLARSRSSSTFDPLIHQGDEWHHVLSTRFGVSDVPVM